MQIAEIKVKISKSGEVKFEVQGVKGEKCLKTTEELEKLLDGEIVKREKTKEFEEEEITISTTEEINQKIP